MRFPAKIARSLQLLGTWVGIGVSALFAATITVDVNIMPRVVFTGDSQTCGRVGALDYPQMLSWEMPVRVFNTAVGGTNTQHLVEETSGGTATVRRGERNIEGENVGWHAGPYPGQRIRLGAQVYTIDRIEQTRQRERRSTLWITEPAKEEFAGNDYAIEPGWRARVAERRPDYACFMYSVNDTGATASEFRARLDEIVRRCRDAGLQPIFLSGFPLMDAAKGGAEPGDNRKVDLRATELAAFCKSNGVPFGDVFHALMQLDAPLTSVWVDMVHPTTDGSITALNALRGLFRDLGLAERPYFVRGYRSRSTLVPPDDSLQPFSTSQPDYTADNKPNDNLFDLAAIQQRDEYGLIAAADGAAVESATPIVLRFGVGPATPAVAKVVVVGESRVSWFDARSGAWQEIARGRGALSARLPARSGPGLVWLAVSGEGKVALDYAAVTVEGEVPPAPLRSSPGTIGWPAPGDRDGSAGGKMIPAESWRKIGGRAVVLRGGVVVEGTGGFEGDVRVDRFKSAGEPFAPAVRPLDTLQILDGPEEVRGNYLVGRVEDDRSIRVRRFLPKPVAGLKFAIVRSSGCTAVAEKNWLQCSGDSYWEATVSNLAPGQYRLGFCHRAYNPTVMTARMIPGRLVRVRAAGNVAEPETSFQWQRMWLDFTVRTRGDVILSAAAKTNTPVEYTGFTLTAR